MRHFFTKSTVEASIYCNRCGKDTMWVIAGGRPAYCKSCYDKVRDPKPVPQKKQPSLFD